MSLESERRAAYLWAFRVEDRGFEAAVCDKYPELFANDAVLSTALKRYTDARATIALRMREITDEVSRASQPKEPPCPTPGS